MLVVAQTSGREVDGVSVLSHGPIKEVINLLGQEHIVRHDLHVFYVLTGFNVN